MNTDLASSRDARTPPKSYLAIHQTLKRQILMRQLQPRQPLAEVDLAERFNVSRARVREALIHLAREGLAASSPYGGYIVPEVSIQELKELYEMRLLLEPSAAERAANNAAGQAELLGE